MNSRVLLRVTFVVLLVLSATKILPDYFPATRDFVEYYSAAKVLADGGNPYDGTATLAVQRAITNEPDRDKSISLWTPPWTLPLYLPLGFLPFSVAHLAWLAVQAAAVAIAVEWLWFVYRGASSEYLLPHVVTLLFAPVFWNWHFGRTTAFLLLGLAGIVYFRYQAKPYRAGMWLALLAIKPHLLAVVGIWAVLDGRTPPGRRMLLMGITTLIVASLLCVPCRPMIFQDYLTSLTQPTTETKISPTDWRLPLVSYYVRIHLNYHAFWIQFVPCLLACAAAAIYYWRRQTWNWSAELPWGVLFSVLLAPYGGWIFDLTVLVVVLLYLLGRATRLPKTQYVVALIGLVLASISGFRYLPLEEFWYVTPVLGLVGIVIEIRVRRFESANHTVP